MMLLAEADWITGIVSAVGAGGLATIVTTWINARNQARKEGREADRVDRIDINQITIQRLAETEKRLNESEEKERVCNHRVTELEGIVRDLRSQNDSNVNRLLVLEDQLITAVISADSSMKIVSWNQGATLMFGYLAADMIGKDVDLLVPGYMKQKHHDAYEKAINDLDAVTNWTNARPVVGVHRDGHEFPVELVINSYRNTSGAKFFEARINKPRAS